MKNRRWIAGLLFTCTGGDALLPGLEGQAIEFTASYG